LVSIMISKKLVKTIFDEALATSTADETLVIISGGKSALARFCNNQIDQHILKKNYTVTVVTAFGRKVGVASSNLFERGELMRIVDVASTVAMRQKEDPLWQPLSSAMEYNFPKAVYDDNTTAENPSGRADAVARITDMVLAAGKKVAGSLTTGDDLMAIGTSHGLFAYHNWTTADFTLTVETPEGSSGWSEGCANSLASLNLDELTKRAMLKAELALNPIEIDCGHYDAILEPPATGTLLRNMAVAGMGGLGFNEGRSFLSGKLGEKILGDNITIFDDYSKGSMKGIPFDCEGIPRQKLMLIEKGVAKAVAHSRRTAAKAEVENTGHALPYPSIYGPIPLNIHLQAGKTPKEEIIKKTKKALLVTRTWYESITNPKLPELTGMTRDGTYLIENGKITNAVKNLRFNENLSSAEQLTYPRK
jgi:predicted Zn-dependent protease